MKYIILCVLILSFYSCKKENNLINDLQTRFDIVNAQGTSARSFQYGEELAFRYSIKNVSKYSIDYYNDNCPMMSCRVYDSNDSLIGAVTPDNLGCVESLYVSTLQSKEQKVYQANWSDDPNNINLPVGTYKVKIQDDITFVKSPEKKTVDLEIYFRVE